MRAPRGKATTKPCENCGVPVTFTPSQAQMRTYWACGRVCAAQLRLRNGNNPVSWGANPLRGQKDTRPCAECGEPVTRYLSDRVNAQVWTCSRRCVATYYSRKRIAEGTRYQPVKPRRGITEPCPTCGTLVYRNKGDVERGTNKYCSIACKNVGISKPPVIKACVSCGKELRLTPSQAARVTCSKRCDGLARTKRPGDRQHNGKPIRYDNQGYVMVWEPEHPNKAFHGWQYEHRLVAEQTIGRLLRSDEHVHHIDGQKANNQPSNLKVMDGVEHAALSARDYRDKVTRERDERTKALARLEEYERRFGPLPKED